MQAYGKHSIIFANNKMNKVETTISYNILFFRRSVAIFKIPLLPLSKGKSPTPFVKREIPPIPLVKGGN